MSAQTLDGAPKTQRSRFRRVLDFVTTGPRDLLINTILASPSVRASSQSASFSLFSPLSIQGLQLERTKGKEQRCQEPFPLFSPLRKGKRFLTPLFLVFLVNARRLHYEA